VTTKLFSKIKLPLSDSSHEVLSRFLRGSRDEQVMGVSGTRA